MKGIRTKLNRVHDGGTFRMVTVRSVISRSPNKIGFIIPSLNHKIKINGNYTDEYFGHTDQTVKKKKSKLKIKVVFLNPVNICPGFNNICYGLIY